MKDYDFSTVINEDGDTTFQGNTVYLTPNQERVLQVLLKYNGKFVRPVDIYDTLYPTMNEVYNYQQVYWYAHQLRKKLLPLGLGLERRPMRGYRLIKLENTVNNETD